MNRLPFLLLDKHVLITGASSGIGKQCAITCSHFGAKVTLVGRDEIRLAETKKLMDDRSHILISQDISDLKSISNVVDNAVNTNGKISGFIHSAGIEKTLPLKFSNPELIDRLFKTNTYSGLEFVRAIFKKKSNYNEGASIIFISSIAGCYGQAGIFGYSATKGALLAATKSLAIELSKNKVRVNSISPGHIANTFMSNEKESNLPQSAITDIYDSHPLGSGSTDDVANSALFLLSDASKWITGINLIVDGGYSAR